MKILYVASEVYPFFKTGGLADVMHSLPEKISELGHDVSIIMPKYNKIDKRYLNRLQYISSININGEIFNILGYTQDKINYFFVENMKYYERGRVYGDYDEDFQYAVFCEVILRFLKKENLKFDLIHCNDWQTGPFPYFLKTRYIYDEFYSKIKVIYTIHNLMYQGKFNNSSLINLGYNIQSNNVNFMVLGISYADIVNTVSPTYAKEITYPYFAEGLEWLTSFKKIYGILNGIDYNLYNPLSTDGILPYDANNIEMKLENKKRLQEEFNLKKIDVPVIGLVSRLVEGKGLDLIVSKIEDILINDDVQLIFLGSGSKYYEDFFRELEYRFPNKFKAYIGYSERISNLIYAGSDIFLMPSRYEPCGLSQMIAMRFGTIPLVRETGGLKDSVISYNLFTEEGNGFSFRNFNADDMLFTIRLAIDFYYNNKEIWNKLVKKNMNIDNSWNRSAKEYIKLYDKML